jgi:telomerase reverse transcriptase
MLVSASEETPEKKRANLLDVLNRYPDADDRRSTAHIMKYIFPRQFGLHNVFTCSVKKSDTSQHLHDYTNREHEIAQSDYAKELKRPRIRGSSTIASLNLPKRLRGQGFALVQAFRKRHGQGAHTELLRYYCPRQVSIIRCTSGPDADHQRMCKTGGRISQP